MTKHSLRGRGVLHIVEMPDWLSQHVDPDWRDAIPPMDLNRIELLVEQVDRLSAEGRHDPATVAQLQNVIGRAKGYLALSPPAIGR